MKRSSKLAFFAVVVLGCVLTARAMARELTPTDRMAARADSATVIINGVGFAWSPNDVTIQVGDSVMWSANFSLHPLRQVDGPTTDTPPPGGFAYSGPEPSFTYQFNSAGTFYYQCAVHGLAAFGGTMRGRIVVQAAARHTDGDGDFGPTSTPTQTATATATSSPTATATPTGTATPCPLCNASPCHWC